MKQVTPRQVMARVDLLILIERLHLGLWRQMHDSRQNRGWPELQFLINCFQKFIVLRHILENAQQEMR